MLRRAFLYGSLAGGAILAASAGHAAPVIQLDISGGALAQALTELTVQSSSEILFDEQIVQGIQVAPVRGAMQPEEALRRMLAGTNVGYRMTLEGAVVLYRLSSETARASEAAIPEILVVGRRTQNVDIRRTENDVQPYKVTTRRDILRAHRSNIEEYTRTRMPANAQRRTSAQDTTRQRAKTGSELDLRGLGGRRTLVLVDGKQLPRPASALFDFGQPDLNGVPLSAIERIETLTGTAGGIYGPSALGGVVNVILRRAYQGADLVVTSGITSRGDAEHWRIEGRAGFSSEEGRTNVMLLASHHKSTPLQAGERDYHLRARQKQFANDPAAYLTRREAGNSVTVSSLRDRDLVLDSELNGSSIGARYTYLPVGFTGSKAEGIALLRENAGKLDLTLPEDRSGAFEYIASVATVTSGLLNVRHQVSNNIEVFVDALAFRNRGSFTTNSLGVSPDLAANAAGNPFTDPITFRFPLLGASRDVRNTIDTARLSAGLIATLPLGWSVTADYSTGIAHETTQEAGSFLDSSFTTAIVRGEVDPLGSWAGLVAATASYLKPIDSSLDARSEFSAANLRLGGPLLRLSGGPLTLTLLAEHSRGYVPERSIIIDPDFPRVFRPEYGQSVSSAYAELRAPLVSDEARLLRGLQLQLALRYDRTATKFSPLAVLTEPRVGPLTTLSRDGVNYTIGVKYLPLPRLLLRASLATGELSPTVSQLRSQPTVTVIRSSSGLLDPKRGGELAGGGLPISVVMAGSAENKPEVASSVTAGAVLNPAGDVGPRLSIDYSRIEVRREIVSFSQTRLAVLANEEAFPGRVKRGPLSDADTRRGFAAGPITELDLTDRNEGTTITEVIDVEFDWRLPLAGNSEVQFYGSGTWQPRLVRRRSAGQAWIDRVGYFDGPLAWRGNLGAEWTRGTLSVDVNMQVFDGYRVAYADRIGAREALIAIDNEQAIRYQGNDRIRSQAYFDVAIRYRLGFSSLINLHREFDIHFGIQNIFDTRTPLVANDLEVPYSTYGDPRGRRFELSISTRF
jgi:outer membrane receptor protein involved in Fe transport